MLIIAAHDMIPTLNYWLATRRKILLTNRQLLQIVILQVCKLLTDVLNRYNSTYSLKKRFILLIFGVFVSTALCAGRHYAIALCNVNFGSATFFVTNKK